MFLGVLLAAISGAHERIQPYISREEYIEMPLNILLLQYPAQHLLKLVYAG